jgi:hypothetical protein
MGEAQVYTSFKVRKNSSISQVIVPEHFSVEYYLVDC